MPDIPPAELQAALQRAIDAWLDRKWREETSRLGSWLLKLVALAVFVAVARWALNQHVNLSDLH
jgi:hypothetical protein